MRAVQRVFGLAMEPRVNQLDDDHHPAYLHPSRTGLVLLGDVGEVDVSVLIVGLIHESRDAGLRVGPKQVFEQLGEAAQQAVAAIPLPGDERLVERLVALGPGSALAALAERLDHLRHLHLREDLADVWADSYDEVVRAWLPFAGRVHPKLATRYAHWVRTFVKRL